MPVLTDRLVSDNFLYQMGASRDETETCFSWGVGIEKQALALDIAVSQRVSDREAWLTPNPIWIPGSPNQHVSAKLTSTLLFLGLTLSF